MDPIEGLDIKPDKKSRTERDDRIQRRKSIEMNSDEEIKVCQPKRHVRKNSKILERKLINLEKEKEKHRLEIQNERKAGIQRRKSVEMDPID